MSRHMQIEIKIIPFYERGFQNQFPRLAKMLLGLSYDDPIEKEVPLYNLIDILRRMSRDPKVPLNVKEKIHPSLQILLPLKEKARNHLLARRLNELDQVLYQIEDAFEDLEKGL